MYGVLAIGTMATNEEKEAILTKPDNVEAGVLKWRGVQVENVGKRTNLPGNLYGDTNFYIRSSAQYVGDRKLSTYIYFYYMQYIYFVVFLVSCLSPLNFILAVFMMVINVFFLLFYSQHLYVNIKTMRYVLRQPTLPDNKLPTKNAHYKITMAEFSLAYAQTREYGIGIVSADGDSVQIQFFKESTMLRMKVCVIISTISFFVSTVMVLYCNLWSIIAPRQWNN